MVQPETGAFDTPRGLWGRLPAHLWERIFSTCSDTAALCFELNHSFKTTAQDYLLRHNILPRSLLRLQETRACMKRDLCSVLALPPAVVRAKAISITSAGKTTLIYNPSTTVQPLLEENGGLAALQKRLASKRLTFAKKIALHHKETVWRLTTAYEEVGIPVWAIGLPADPLTHDYNEQCWCGYFRSGASFTAGSKPHSKRESFETGLRRQAHNFYCEWVKDYQAYYGENPSMSAEVREVKARGEEALPKELPWFAAGESNSEEAIQDALAAVEPQEWAKLQRSQRPRWIAVRA